MDEILDLTLRIAAVFRGLDVPYLIGGSVASSLHGIPRSTQDVDMVAALTDRHVPTFVRELRDAFYLDEDAIRDAIRRRTSFNVIHLGSYFKADIFLSKDDDASALQMERRQTYELDGDPTREIVVASAEDVVAQKLAWFALGQGVSSRQWEDAVGVLTVSGPRLDFEYLERIAGLLGVTDQLRRAREEVARLGSE